MAFIYFLVYLFIEIMISSSISSYLGGFLTFLEVIFSAIVGVYLIKTLPEIALSNIQSLFKRELDIDSFIKVNIIYIIGAILLIVPGFFTDILGIILQFEFIAIKILKYFTKEKINNTNYSRNDDIIDVEIIEEKK